MKQLHCPRCGITHKIGEDAWQMRLTRGVINPDWCGDCRGANPKSACRGWKGDVDDNFQPMFKGKPYLPGFRKCGRVDCVNKAHILGLEAVDAPSGRTCSEPGCLRPFSAMGKCSMHYRRDHRRFGSRRIVSDYVREALLAYRDSGFSGPICGVPDCGRPHRAKGLCYRHYKAAWECVNKAVFRQNVQVD